MPEKPTTQAKSGPSGGRKRHVAPPSSLTTDGIASASGRSSAPRQSNSSAMP